MILQQSSLAKTLATLYHDLNEKSSCHLLINESMDISMTIPPIPPQLEYNIMNTTSDPSIYPDIRPYYTLIVLTDPEEILSTLPMDCSPLLIRLIQIITPTQK